LQVQLNGECREFLHQNLSLSELIQELSLAPQRIAVELNKQIVRRDEWDKTSIKEGDQIEIVHFVGGGH
jgi:thiamine biosynthesis protein ThiS